MTPPDFNGEDQDLIRQRQKSRALILALLLGALVILVFAITIAKIRAGMA